jgi:hypothetical protein
MEKIIKVLIVEPLKEPYPAEIENTLAGMQMTVGGLIEPIFLKKGVDIVCNEEAKLIGLTGNRSLGVDIIAGTFFVVGSNDEGEFVSLTEDEMRKCAERFQKPEVFTQEQVEDTIGFTLTTF